MDYIAGVYHFNTHIRHLLLGHRLGYLGRLVGPAACGGHVDAEDLFSALFLYQSLVGLQIIAWAGTGRGGQDFSRLQPAQELLSLDSHQITQHFLSTMDIVGHHVDFQLFEQGLRDAGAAIGKHGDFGHGRHSCRMKCRFLRNYNPFLPKSKPGSEISLKNTGKITSNTEEDGLMRKITLLTLIFCFLLPVSTARAGEPLLSVFYSGPQGGVYQALMLDNSAQITDDPAQADVFLLNGVLPANGDLSLISRVYTVRGGIAINPRSRTIRQGCQHTAG